MIDLRSFNKELDNRAIAKFESKIKTFKAIKDDLVELDEIMLDEIRTMLFMKAGAEYEDLVYFYDDEIANGLMSEADIKHPHYDLHTIGIDFEYNQGLFGTKVLGMYNVYRNMYANKCYNMNDYPVYLSYFLDDYAKTLEKIFYRYKHQTELELVGAIKRFEELFKNNLI